MIKREILENIVKNVKPGFVNIIYGPRRVGKTVLLKQIAEHYQLKPLLLNGDFSEDVSLLDTASKEKLDQLISGEELLLIDEAQRIPNIGLALKIIIDTHPRLKIFVTGSSSLALAKGVKENLVGRNKTYHLYPLSFQERTREAAKHRRDALIPELLTYGSYPYLLQIKSNTEKKLYLDTIVSDYLFKDVFYLERIDRPEVFKKMTELLAFQIGQPVSLNELSNSLGISVKTISRYLDLLEKAFVIFSLNSYSTNLRKEMVKTKKYYFYDLGIRNALIGQFTSPELRPDIGSLWENFLLLERVKKNEYRGKLKKYYFWRAYQGAEVDFLEQDDEGLRAYEFKWGNRKYITPKLFKEKYGLVEMINRENYQDFILP